MAEKNIEVSRLKKGNKILLETKECVFDIEIVSPDTGDIIISGGKRFLNKTEAVLVGVYGRRTPDDTDKMLVEKQVERGLGLEVRYLDKDKVTCDFVTSPVISAKIYDDGWSFEMWNIDDKQKKLAQSLEEARARLRVKTEPKKEDTDENTLS